MPFSLRGAGIAGSRAWHFARNRSNLFIQQAHFNNLLMVMEQ